MKTILTGIRPTGNLHLGHYFGACKNWLKLQDEYKFYLEIADVQALTDNFNNPEKIRENVFELTCDLLSIGIDPNKVNIFIQSKNFFVWYIFVCIYKRLPWLICKYHCKT